ncbi:MAG TPA: SRPBCC family protein [Opitutaceae bacterium]|nr:SRPBCC family protein [Opitutaceae bacterium]
MKWIFIGLGALATIVALMALIGAFLPREHVATRRASYARPAAELYRIARDFAAAPTWRTDLKSVELLPPRDGRVSFRETSRHGAIAFVVREDRPGERIVTEIADPDLPFGGTWTYEFSNESGRGVLRITERGEVKNVLFRFLGRFVFGEASTIETYLRSVGRKLGEETTPQP